jgi:hypothetical protein
VFLAILVQAEIDEKTPRKTGIPADVSSDNQEQDACPIAASLADYFTDWFERLSFPTVVDRGGP